MAKTWLVWKSKGSSIIPRYEIEDNDPDNWKQGEEHDLNIRRLYPASFDGQFILQLECEGGDLDKDEVIDDGSENWEDDFVVTPTAPNFKIEVKSEDTDIEIENEEVLEQEDILNWNRIIIYKTNDNQPITNLSGTLSDFESNVYDEENDYCILTLKNDCINLNYPIFASNNTLTEIIYLPSCLENIGNVGFCSNCTLLQSINLSNLINLENIGNGFCAYCSSLQNINLNNLINLQSIGSSFCNDAPIQSIDLSKCVNLKDIGTRNGYSWLSNSLKEIKLLNYFDYLSHNFDYLENLIITSEEFQDNLPTYLISNINENLKIWVHDDLYSQYIETYTNLKEYFWCIEDEEQHLPEYNTNNYEYVDMGEAGYWATCNIGANSPEQIGLYFQWADINGYAKPSDKSKGFNYPYCVYLKSGTNDISSKWSKYVTDSNFGTVDNKKILELTDDAAHVIMGGDWRMPTKEEFKKLYDLCDTEWTDNYNETGTNGIIFTLKTDTSKRIFFPTTGYISGTTIQGTDSSCIWVSSLYTSVLNYYAHYVSFNQSAINMEDKTRRINGLNIRGFIPKS